jgi:hypothetical protein
MSWVLIYIATKFLAPIPLISLGIDDFLFQVPPKSTNSSCRISQKIANRLKPALRPAKAGPIPAKASRPAGPRHLARSAPLLATPSTCSTSAHSWPRSARHIEGPCHRLVSAARHSCSPPALACTHAWPQHRSTSLPPLLFP